MDGDSGKRIWGKAEEKKNLLRQMEQKMKGGKGKGNCVFTEIKVVFLSLTFFVIVHPLLFFFVFLLLIFFCIISFTSYGGLFIYYSMECLKLHNR